MSKVPERYKNDFIMLWKKAHYEEVEEFNRRLNEWDKKQKSSDGGKTVQATAVIKNGFWTLSRGSILGINEDKGVSQKAKAARESIKFDEKGILLEDRYKEKDYKGKLSDKEIRENVQNIAQTKGAIDTRAFYNKEAKQKELQRIEASLTNVSKENRKAVAQRVFKGYEDFRSIT